MREQMIFARKESNSIPTKQAAKSIVILEEDHHYITKIQYSFASLVKQVKLNIKQLMQNQFDLSKILKRDFPMIHNKWEKDKIDFWSTYLDHFDFISQVNLSFCFLAFLLSFGESTLHLQVGFNFCMEGFVALISFLLWTKFPFCKEYTKKLIIIGRIYTSILSIFIK